jgi:hypothetical protein
VPGILARLAPDAEWEHDWAGRRLKWYEPLRGRDALPKFFARLGDFDSRSSKAGNMVAVPVHLELRVKANGRTIRDLEMHLWTQFAEAAAS